MILKKITCYMEKGGDIVMSNEKKKKYKYKFSSEEIDGYIIVKQTDKAGFVNAEAYFHGKLVKSLNNIQVQVADMKENE